MIKDKITNFVRKTTKGRRRIAFASIAAIIVLLATLAPIHVTYTPDADGGIFTIGQGKYSITIGNLVSAQEADYTCDGIADDVQFQQALDALPDIGGQLFAYAGSYNWTDSTTVTRVIDNVSIIGVGAAVYFYGDGSTPLFSAGGDNWLFSNLRTDAGGLNMGSTTDWMWLHISASTSYYPLRTDNINIEDHSSLHAVGGSDTVFPTDPNADKYLMWDDDPGQLSWEDAGGGDMLKSTYDTDEDGDIDTAAGGTEWDSSVATGVAYITAGAWGTRATGISNTYILIVDDADAANDDFAKFTASGLEGRDYSEVRSDLGLVIGTDVQAYDTELAAIAGLTSATDKMIYFTGSGTAATADLTSFARSILDDANEATFKATVNLEIGTDVQAWDTDLDDIAALSDADSNFIVGNGVNWVVESGATVRASLGLIIGTDVQAYDTELAALAGLTSAADKVPYFTGSGTANVADLTSYGRSIIATVNEAGFKQLVNLEIGTDVLAQQTIGIADDNLVEMDDADAADNDYAKFTSGGLEGRSYSEVLGDLSGQAEASFDWNGQDLTNVGDVDGVDISTRVIAPESTTTTQIISDGLRSNTHNVMQCIQENIWSFNGKQYAVFVDSTGDVIAAKRTLPSGSWATQDTGKDVVTTDFHRGASLGIDPDGYIHVFYGFHNDGISGHYIRSTNAEDISAWTDKTQMTGSNEDSVCYVKCFTNASYLFCVYRNGVSGDGEVYLNKYDHSTTTWSAVAAPLINPTADSRNPYVSTVAIDGNGYFHIAWCWRENITNEGWVNKNVCYGKSENSGVTWKKSDGNTYSLPITYAASEVVDSLGIGDGLYNDPQIATDTSNIPHIVYQRCDDYDFINYFHAWLDSGDWEINQVTSFVDIPESAISWGGTTWGGSTRPPPLPKPSIITSGTTAYVLFPYPSGARMLHAAVASSPYTSWAFHRLGTDVWGTSAEINFDKAYWASNSKLHLLISAVDYESGAIPVCCLETTPSSWGSAFPFSILLEEVTQARVTERLLKLSGVGTRIRVYRATSVQSIPDSTWTVIDFNAKTFDSLNEFDLSTDRYTVTQEGLYLISLTARIEEVPDQKNGLFGIRLNGSDYPVSARCHVSAAVWGHASAPAMAVLYLDVGDYIEGCVYHNSGGARDLSYGEYGLADLTITRLL